MQLIRYMRRAVRQDRLSHFQVAHTLSFAAAFHVCQQVFPHAWEIPQATTSGFPALAQAGGFYVTLSTEPVKVRPAQAEHFSRNLAVAKFRGSVVRDAYCFGGVRWLCHEANKAPDDSLERITCPLICVF